MSIRDRDIKRLAIHMSEALSKIAGRLKTLSRIYKSGDLFLFLSIFLFAASVPLLMRLKLTRLQQLLELGNAPQLPEPDEVHKVAICVETVLQPDRCFIRRKCLTRGLTLYYFLRRIGFDVVLCFGMGIINGEFAGHCWLIKDGEPFMETKDPRPVFAVIYSIPRSIAVPAGSQTEDQEVARP